MKSPSIQIVCPAKPGTRYGNRITALRWQKILRQLGCRTKITMDLNQGSPDLLLALHARRSAGSILDFHRQYPERPIILTLTGTDLYRDIRNSAAAKTSLRLANRIIVLQEAGRIELTPALRGKTRVIYQSVTPLRTQPPARPRQLRVIVAGHLRDVKDPFRAARAVRRLPTDSRVVVDHYGAAMNGQMAHRAREEMRRNARYRWHGEVPRGTLRRLIKRSWLMVLSSKMEGGANVLSEALADGTPVLASRISGSVGILGTRYQGYFTVGNTKELQILLRKCAEDHSFYATLQRQCAKRAFLVHPERELAAWRRVLAEFDVD